MGTNGTNASRYCGYRTPFYDEICSERMFAEALRRHGSSTFSVGDFVQLPSLSTKLNQAADPVSDYLKGQFSAPMRQTLENYLDSNSDPTLLRTTLAKELNRIIQSPSFYDAQRFARVVLRPESQQLLDQDQKREAVARLNKMLLEDAYPLEISRNEFNFLPVGRQMKVFEREKLDLLALDQFAHPWIFEFKRDLAPYESIAQLLAYGSYVAQWSRKELEDKYKKHNRGRCLANAFKKRFGSELPEQLRSEVNLVLAAFEFSLPCRRALEFLEHCSGLVIGRLKIDCLWDLEGPLSQPDYRWLRNPRRTRALDLNYEWKIPESYYMLSQAENNMALTWSQCVSNRLLPIPLKWDLPAHPIVPGSGVFVNLCGLQSRKKQGPFCGLVGYGLTIDEPFDLRTRMDEFELTPGNVGRLAAFKGAIWVVPIRWLQTREADADAAVTPTRHIIEETGLGEIQNNFQNNCMVGGYKADLGVEEHDPFEKCSENPPDDDPGLDTDFFRDFQGIYGDELPPPESRSWRPGVKTPPPTSFP